MRSFPLTYEVLDQEQVERPFRFSVIELRVRRGKLSADASYRRTGTSDWKPLRAALKRNRLGETILFGLSAIILVVAGIWMANFGWRMVGLIKETASWPVTDGRVTFSASQNIDGYHRFEWWPEVNYVYIVNSRRFSGDVIYPGCAKGRKSWAQSIVDRYPGQSACRVYYNPKNPGISLLDPGLAPHSYTFFVLGLVTVYLAGVFGMLALHTARQPIGRPSSKAFAILTLSLVGLAIIAYFVAFNLP